jgi:DNA-binding beta-propeller fold protein YncE
MDFGNYRIAHLSTENKLLNAFGSLGTAPEQIFSGWDMATDAGGNIYISNQISDNANTKHEGIKVFSPEGQFLREIGGVDYAPEVERVYSVYGLDVDSVGRVYTADFGTSTVRVFAESGVLLAELFGESGAGDGQFNGLSDVAVDEQRGYLYASDNLNSRVQQFRILFGNESVTATLERSFGRYGRAPGQFAYPQNLAVDENTGHLFVGDVANRRIQVFDSEGQFLNQIGLPAEVTDWQVMGLNVNNAGALYVADALNNAVWVFASDGTLRYKIEARP